MSRHLSEVELVDLIDGEGTGEGRQHVAGCARCRAHLEDAREGWAQALAAEVPEPSPLYWKSLRRQVQRGVQQQRPLLRRFSFGPLLAAAAAVLAVVSLLARSPTPVPTTEVADWSALPPVEDDAAFEVLIGLELTADELVEVADCAWATCLEELSDEESLAFTEALRDELEGRDL